VAVDPFGHLYVTDVHNNRVLGWSSVQSFSNGESAALVIGQTDFYTGDAASSVSASTLSLPAGVAADASGNVYVADTGDSRVLIFSNPFAIMNATGQNTGFVAFAVIGQVGNFTSHGCNVGATTPSADTLCSPQGAALDKSGNLYVADTNNNRVLEYDAPVGADTIAADRVFGQLGDFTTNILKNGGVSKESLDAPTEVAVDKNNNLYVADFGENRVLEYDTPLTVTIVAGSGDTSADEVWGQGGSFTSSTCNLSGVSATSLCFPIGVALDGSANLYIADTSNNRVLELNESSNPPSNQTANHVFGQSSFSGTKCNQTGAAPTSTTLCNPTGLATDISAELVVLDGSNNRVLKYATPLSSSTATGVLGGPDFTHAFSSIDPSSLQFPQQIAIDPSAGGIAVADELNNRVLGWRDVSTFVDDAPADIVIGEPDFYSSNLVVPPTATSLSNPVGVAFDPNGNLYVSDTDNNRVLEYKAPFTTCATFPCVVGAASDVFGQPDFVHYACDQNSTASASTLCKPKGLAVDGFGNLYVADYGNNRILEYNTPLKNTTVTGSGDTVADLVFGQGATGTAFTTSTCVQFSGLSVTTLCDPSGVGIDPNNNVYISDTQNDRVLEYNETVSAIVAPSNVSADAVFGQNDQFTKDLFLATGPNSLTKPEDLGFDAAGDLYIADTVASRVLQFYTPLTTTATSGSGDTTADVVWGAGGDMYTAFCGLSPAALCDAFSVAVDASGNVYISDWKNNRITAYSPPYPPPGAEIAPVSSGVLTIRPRRIRFLATRVGKTRTRTVTLNNRGPVAVTLGSFSALGDFTYANGCPAQLLPGQHCSIVVRFSPITSGRRGGGITISDDAQHSPHQIELSGRGRLKRGAR
jgi:sugar lactone lactonase YvrE